MAYAYNEAGNRKQLVTRTGNTVINQNDYTYDAKNRLVQLNNSKLGAFRFAYDPMDRRTSLQYPNGITSSYAYDKAYRLSAIVSKNSSNQILDAWSYQYDSVGNRTSKTDMDGNIETYGYDNVYRLTDAHYSGGTREAFTYDPVGNRLTQLTETGQNLTYSYDIANQLLSAGTDTFTYDANGNTKTKTTATGTTSFTYDIKNRITAIAGPDGSETSTFAPDDTRVRMNNSSLTGDEKILYDFTGNPVTTYGGNSYEYERVYGPGTDELLGEWKGENSRRYYTHDALGSITSATDETGAVRYKRTYRPFGTMTSTAASGEALSSRFGFTGREIWVGSTMQYRARQYDVAYGRFSLQDPMYAYNPKITNNKQTAASWYAFVSSSPTNRLDPTGLCDDCPTGIWWGGAAMVEAMLGEGKVYAGALLFIGAQLCLSNPYLHSDFVTLCSVPIGFTFGGAVLSDSWLWEFHWAGVPFENGFATFFEFDEYERPNDWNDSIGFFMQVTQLFGFAEWGIEGMKITGDTAVGFGAGLAPASGGGLLGCVTLSF